jgi:hypothetical protein
MTIFSILKYPISNIPTQEELEALPISVFEEWRKFVLDNHHKDWYSTTISVGVLRLMIYDIDENMDVE